MNKHILTHYESITKKEWIKNLRALRHNQRRHYDCLPAPISILQLQVAATWRTDFNSWVGLSSMPEIGSEMWNHANEIRKEVFW